MNAYFAVAVINVAAIAGAVYLIANDHPWLGILVLCFGGASASKSKDKS